MATANIKNRSTKESLGILTGAGGCQFFKVDEDGGTTGSGDSSLSVLNARGIIVAVTLLTTDGDQAGTGFVNLTTLDSDFHPTVLNPQLEPGDTIYGRFNSQFSMWEGNSAIVYTESNANA
jgi:hypothetical protein